MRLAMPDAWVRQDGRGKQLAESGLDAAGIKRAVLTLLEQGGAGAVAEREIEPKSVGERASR